MNDFTQPLVWKTIKKNMTTFWIYPKMCSPIFNRVFFQPTQWRTNCTIMNTMCVLFVCVQFASAKTIWQTTTFTWTYFMVRIPHCTVLLIAVCVWTQASCDFTVNKATSAKKYVIFYFIVKWEFIPVKTQRTNFKLISCLRTGINRFVLH